MADEYESKNKALQIEVEDLKRNLNQCQQNYDEKVRSLENVNKTFFFSSSVLMLMNEGYNAVVYFLALN